MKFQFYKIIFTGLILLNTLFLFAQRDLTPSRGSKRSSAFGGPQDFRDLKNYGIQFTAGLDYQFTKKKNEIVHVPIERPYDYVIDPKGYLGVFFDIGMAHFPLGTPRLTLLKSRFISYYDWGVGFKLLGGSESADVTYLSDGKLSHAEGSFYNGYVTGRGTAHKNIYFSQKYYIDNGLGLNLDYRVIEGNKQYSSEVQSPAIQNFHKPLVAQIHYDLGLGIKKKRGSYVIPGIQLPLLGIVGGARLDWFSSKYYPVLFKVKFIVLSEKKKSKTSCSEGSEEDRKRNKEYMQGQ
jgi:hypothetical protein